MNENPLTQQEINNQFSDLIEMIEQREIKLTPQVSKFLHEGMNKVLNQFEENKKVTKSDLQFLEDVKMWIRMPKKMREKCPDLYKLMEMDEKPWEERETISITQARLLGEMIYGSLKKTKIEELTGDPEEELEVFDNAFDIDGNRIIAGDLEVEELDFVDQGITELPEGIYFNCTVYLQGNPFKKFPKGFNVNGLMLNNSEVDELPEGMNRFHGLSISKTKITKLPDDLKIFEDLFIMNSLVTELPAKTKIGRTLYMDGSLVQSLPENLYVGRLELKNTQITELPDGLVVSETLNIVDSKVKTINPNIQKIGKLIIGWNASDELRESISKLMEQGKILALEEH